MCTGIDFQTFVTVAANFKPMEWQVRLACGSSANLQDKDSLRRGEACTSRVMDIPTGCGKTAGAVLAWLWNRVVLEKPEWPRRLVYCLPMRTLLEQTEKRISAWILRLSLASTNDNT